MCVHIVPSAFSLWPVQNGTDALLPDGMLTSFTYAHATQDATNDIHCGPPPYQAHLAPCVSPRQEVVSIFRISLVIRILARRGSPRTHAHGE
jgi:hypothetical protein